VKERGLAATGHVTIPSGFHDTPNRSDRVDILVEMRCGSHLHGTATDQSDLDYKAVFLPSARDILLQRVRDTIEESRPRPPGEKNRPGDIDRQSLSLKRYLELLAEGQTMALDMLFAPAWALTRAPDPIWEDLQANTDRLITRRASIFIRHCRQQANRYGIMGSRVTVVRRAVEMLVEAITHHGAQAKLRVITPQVAAFAKDMDHAELVDLAAPDGQTAHFLEVCGKKMAFQASLGEALATMTRLRDAYGQRALEAERNAGVDWKALSHAVRVGREALDLLTTGRLHFPLPYASELLAIKRGDVPYATVADTIEGLLIAVERAAVTSALPDEPDQAFIDDLIVRAHHAQVLKGGPLV
jgi:hypothetical protein